MSLHTMTLISPTLTMNDNKRIRNKIYALIKDGTMRISCKIKDRLIRVHHTSLSGMGITLLNSQFSRLELRLNPSVLLGHSYAELCDMTPEILRACKDIIDYILELLSAPFYFEDMILSRIDCTQDIDFAIFGSIEPLLRCVRKTRLAYRYRPERFSDSTENWKEKNLHSFRARGTDIDLTIYDKSFQLAEEGLMPPQEIPADRLRMEAAFSAASFQRVIPPMLKAGEEPPKELSDKVQWFSDQSAPLLRLHFGRVLTPGDYLRYDEAVKRIDASGYQTATKNRMKEFLRRVQRASSIDNACMALSVQGWSRAAIDNLLSRFELLHLNPAVLPASYPYAEVPSLTKLLDIRPLEMS